MEKIRSGQTFLYRESGLNSTVLDVRLKNKIHEGVLQLALTTTLRRFPYMTQKLVEKDGDFYLEENHNGMTAARTKKLRKLGSMGTSYHLVDVTYWDDRLYVSFHHALCDGRGIKPFLETLLYYYFSLRYNKKFDSAGIRLAGEPLLPGETDEPVSEDMLEVDKDSLPQIIKDGFSLPENASGCGCFYRYELKIKRAGFIEYTKSIGATPASLLALLVSGGIHDLYPDAEKPVVCSMAVDYRNEIGLNNTHKNCVGSLYLPYTKQTAKISAVEQARLYRALMKEQRSPDNVRSLVNTQIGLCAKLDSIPTLEGKRQALAFFNEMRIDTYVISYLGQVELGDREQYVESIHLYNSGVPGVRINMICAGDYFTVDLLQDFDSESVMGVLCKKLNDTGVAFDVSERLSFETIKDKAYITASRQAERYYKFSKNSDLASR